MPDATDLSFPSAQFPQVYEINTQGGRPKLYSSLPMEDISVAQDGTTLLYHDQKGYEDPWRKHHTSSITRDIWISKKRTMSVLTRKSRHSMEKTVTRYGVTITSLFTTSAKKQARSIFSNATLTEAMKCS